MSGRIQTAFHTSLHARPQYVDLAPNLRLIWQMDIPFAPTHSRLLSAQGGLYLLDNQQRFVKLSPQQPDPTSLKPWPMLDLRVVAAAPGFLSEPVLRTTNNGIYRWQPSALPTHVWQGDESIVRAYGLPAHQLLLQHADDRSVFIEMVDETQGRLWADETSVFSLACTGDQVLILDKPIGGRLTSYDARTGAKQWETMSLDAPVSDFIGLVDRIVWLATTASRLIAFDVQTGVQLKELPVTTDAAPRGILTPDALYYRCNGLTLEAFDLNADGERRLYREFPRAEEQPTTAFGNQMLINDERTLFMFDDRGRLFTVSAPDYAEAVPVWQADEPVLQYGAADGHLFALQQNGILAVLGSS